YLASIHLQTRVILFPYTTLFRSSTQARRLCSTARSHRAHDHRIDPPALAALWSVPQRVPARTWRRPPNRVGLVGLRPVPCRPAKIGRASCRERVELAEVGGAGHT